MHAPSSLLPSDSSCSSLDRTTVSSMSLPPTTNDLNDREKQRLLKQTRKLSQILGELPQKATAQPHLAGCSTPAAEAPSTDASQPHQQHVRFSRHSFIGSRSRSFRLPLPSYSEAMSDDMSPLRRPSIRDAPVRSSSTRRPSARPSYNNQLDLARFGLGRRRGAESTKTDQSDENTRLTGYSTEVAGRLARSSSLRVPKHVYRTLSKDNLRRRSVHNPFIASSQMPPHNPTGISSSTRLQRRSVSLWTKRSVTKGDSAHQQHLTTVQSREDDASGDEHPPLTEAQRIQRIRRGRKLTQLFGVEPPTALYRIASASEDGPAPPNTITDERRKTYLALSSNDVASVYSGCSSSKHLSHSSVSSISIAVPSSDSLAYEVDPLELEESEGDQIQAVPPLDFDGDLDSVAPDSYSHLDDNATATFRRRRLRAAKLSRFFGVAYNDLSIPTSTATQQSDPPREVLQSAEVDVKIQERGRFWNRAEGGQNAGSERADMNDVIALLRQMPRA